MLARMANPSIHTEAYPTKAQVKTASEKSKFEFAFAQHNASVFNVNGRVFCKLYTLKDGQNSADPKNQVVINMSGIIALRSYLRMLIEKMQSETEERIILDKAENVFLTVKPFETKAGKAIFYCHIRKHYPQSKNSMTMSAGGSGLSCRLEELVRLQEIYPSIMACSASFQIPSNVIYDHVNYRLFWYKEKNQWLDIDRMEFLHEDCSTIEEPNSAYAHHRRLLNEEQQRLYLAAMAAEETVSQKQNMLMEWIVVCLVKEDIKEKEIVGKCDGTYSDENINRSLNEMKSIEIVSIFCTSGMELDIPIYQGFDLAASILVPQNYPRLIEKIRSESVAYNPQDQAMVENINKVLAETLH